MATTFDHAVGKFNVTPRLISVEESNGCTLTRASISTWTPADIEANYFKEVGMDRIIANAKEARLVGVKESALMDLLLSRHVTLKTASGGGSESIIAPFSLVPRRNIINANHFQVEAGAAHPQAGNNGVPAHAWQVTINIGSSPWVQSPNNALKNLEKFILPGKMVVIEWVTAAKVAMIAQFQVLTAANANVGATQKALVTLVPNRTEDWWATADTAAKLGFQPAVGQMSILQNSVSDFESYGHQYGSVLDVNLAEYWQQTFRWAFTYNDEYVKALEAPLTSETFKKFRMLPLAKQRAQQMQFLDREFYNTVFYGEEINEHQTVSGYTSLPRVYDPADTGCPLEFKANTLGYRTQLSRTARITDKQGLPLNLDTIFELVYNLKRNRETANTGSIDRIDCFTDRFTKGQIRRIMTKYYKSNFSAELTYFIQPGQKISFNGATVFEFDIYDLPDQGVQLCVFTDTFFDDRLSAFSAAQKNRGRTVWFPDWTDFVINTLRTSSVKRTTNEADELYRFVMKINGKHTTLNSKTIECRLGDPNRHAIIENFSDECPLVTVNGCELLSAPVPA
jgi:hypothetical protein